MNAALVAHAAGSGWDELLLMVGIPAGVFLFFLLRERRARRGDGPPPPSDHGDG